MEQPQQTVPNLRPHSGQIIPFRDILAQIVEFEGPILEIFDELPVARPNGSAWPRAKPLITGAIQILAGQSRQIGGKVPENRLPGKRVQAVPERKQAPAIKQVISRWPSPGQFQQRREKIHADHRLSARAARRDSPRPAHHERHPNPSLIEHAFPTPQRLHQTGAIDPAVVRQQEHHCILRHAQPLKIPHDPANAPIYTRDHGCIGGIHRAALGQIFLLRLHLRRRSLDRGVNRVVCEIEKKRFRVRGAEKPGGLVGQSIREIFVGCGVLQTGQTIGGKISVWWLSVVVAANVEVESLAFRIQVRLVAQMPFAQVDRRVALRAQRLRQGEERPRQLLSVWHGNQTLLLAHTPIRSAHRVDPMTRTILPCEQGGTGWRTIRSIRIGIGKDNPLPTEPIDVWRAHPRIAHKTEVLPAKVIHQDKHDVGR